MQFSSRALVIAILLATAVAWPQFLPSIGVSPVGFAAGSGDTTITITGRKFTPTMKAVWNGQPLTTTFIWQGTLKALVPAADLAQPGLAQVSLVDASSGSAVAANVPVVIYLPLKVHDLATDASRAVIYASIAKTDPNGPSIAVIDPVKGTVVQYLPMPEEPNFLALSASSSGPPQYLYVGMVNRLRRLDLTGATASVDVVSSNSEIGVAGIFPLPGDGTSFIWINEISRAIVVDGTTARPNSASAPKCLVGMSGNFIFGGPGFEAFQLNSSGLTNVTFAVSNGADALGGTNCPAFGNNLLYASDGDIVSPVVQPTGSTPPVYLNLAGRLTGYGLVAAATDRNAIYYVGYLNAPQLPFAGSVLLLKFDATSQALLQSIPIPTATYGTRLVEWGTKGVAFTATVGTTQALYLLQTP